MSHGVRSTWRNSLSLHGYFGTIMEKIAGVQPRWIQGDLKVGGRSRHLWKNTYLITDIERLETDSVAGKLVEKITWNSARETGSKKEATWGNQSFQKLIQFLYFWVCLYTFCYI